MSDEGGECSVVVRRALDEFLDRLTRAVVDEILGPETGAATQALCEPELPATDLRTAE